MGRQKKRTRKNSDSTSKKNTARNKGSGRDNSRSRKRGRGADMKRSAKDRSAQNKNLREDKRIARGLVRFRDTDSASVLLLSGGRPLSIFDPKRFGLMNGDLIEVSLSRGRQGRIDVEDVKIIRRAADRLVCRYHASRQKFEAISGVFPYPLQLDSDPSSNSSAGRQVSNHLRGGSQNIPSDSVYDASVRYPENRFAEHGIGNTNNYSDSTSDANNVSSTAAKHEGQKLDLLDGEYVLLSIVGYPSDRSRFIHVEVAKRYGTERSIEIDIMHVLGLSGIREAFDKESTAQLVGLQAPILTSDRQDLRSIRFITIDPPDARDFDDAICAMKVGEHYRVHVAVADVSHYLDYQSRLDQEAIERGTSLYLPGRCVPMLPELLSADLCSLRPHEDRYAMTVSFDVNTYGLCSNFETHAALIESKKRFSYNDLAAFVEGDRSAALGFETDFDTLLKVSDILRRRRKREGMLSMEIPEAKVQLAEQSNPLSEIIGIASSRSSDAKRTAYQTVESFMLAANSGVAHYLEFAKMHPLWRVHPPPPKESAENFLVLLQQYGIRATEHDLTDSIGMARISQEIATHAYADALQMMMLRSLSQAAYRAENVGHFGLAIEKYVHFTSPIRRYPDVIIHRMLKWKLQSSGGKSGKISENYVPPTVADIEASGEHLSLAERRMMKTERKIKDVYAAYFMKNKLGEIFTGHFSGANRFGAFFQLKDPLIDVYVPLDYFSETMHYDRERYELSSKRGQVIRLGEEMSLQVERIDWERYQTVASPLRG